MFYFKNDYSETCAPEVLAAIQATMGEHITGYGSDAYCARCVQLIRQLCEAPQADVQFLVGGTQTNFVTIAAFLRPWESVICATTGHVNTHEAGAVEATGHKLMQIQTGPDGKLTPEQILPILEEGEDIHLTKPKLVYISDSTETGGVYTKAELTALSTFCREHDLYLFLDGARLGCALVSEPNDLTLPDLARLTDAFYIGGTKNGAMMGEALVICNEDLQKDFFRIKKQNGAVLAKGWLLAVQFEALLKDGLYFRLAQNAVEQAMRLQAGLRELGFAMMSDSPSNQLFPIVPNTLLPFLDTCCVYEVTSRPDAEHTVIRLVTSFATESSTVDGFLSALKEHLTA